MNKPLIYIIVLNYNRREDTLDCLSSLFRMDYPNFKVLMVDNASSDGTADAVRRQYPQAEVLQNEKNLMYAGGNNAGIELALEHGADWVLLLNNDTVVDERLLSEMVDAAHAHPEAGVLGPMIYYYPTEGAGAGAQVAARRRAGRAQGAVGAARPSVAQEEGRAAQKNLVRGRDCEALDGPDGAPGLKGKGHRAIRHG